jgi:hypothetical protein
MKRNLQLDLMSVNGGGGRPCCRSLGRLINLVGLEATGSGGQEEFVLATV